MLKIVLKIPKFHENLAILNSQCTIVNCGFSIYCISNVWQLGQAMDSSMFCLYVYFCTADYRRLLLIDFPIPAELQKECVLKGHGNEADFLGFFAEIGSSWVPYTTFRAVPILASNLRRYSYSKNDSPLSPIWGVADSLYLWVGESTTPRITDMESRLLNFFKRNSTIRGVVFRIQISPRIRSQNRTARNVV